MKVAKLLLAAAIAAPSLFLTSCEKQIDVQADNVNREATRSLGKPGVASFNFIETFDESGWYLNASTDVMCGTGTFQMFDGSNWVNVTGALSIAPNGFITYGPLTLETKPAIGTRFRVSFAPTKGRNGCSVNLQRSTSQEFSTEL